MSNKRKKSLAKQKYRPPHKNVGSAADPPRSIDSEQFSWSVRQIDLDCEGLWDWKLSPKEVRCLLSCLEEMSCKTWREIKAETVGKRGRAKTHPQSLDTIIPAARARLEDLHIEAEALWRTRLGSSERLWGHLQGSVFYVLWFDRDHRIYDDGS